MALYNESFRDPSPLLGRQPVSTTVQTGIYPYDIEAEGTAANIARARGVAAERPIHGAGGISGAALRRQGEMEGSFLNASIDAWARRRQQEDERRRQEAQIRDARRQQTRAQEMENVASLATGITGLAQDFGAQASGIAKQPLTVAGVGGEQAFRQLHYDGLIEADPNNPGTFKYTQKGVMQQMFSNPYWFAGE